MARLTPDDDIRVCTRACCGHHRLDYVVGWAEDTCALCQVLFRFDGYDELQNAGVVVLELRRSTIDWSL